MSEKKGKVVKCEKPPDAPAMSAPPVAEPQKAVEPVVDPNPVVLRVVIETRQNGDVNLASYPPQTDNGLLGILVRLVRKLGG